MCSLASRGMVTMENKRMMFMTWGMAGEVVRSMLPSAAEA